MLGARAYGGDDQRTIRAAYCPGATLVVTWNSCVASTGEEQDIVLQTVILIDAIQESYSLATGSRSPKARRPYSRLSDSRRPGCCPRRVVG
jgi:hypothetical protein